ncbi:helix-turn-helix domain-containing protein [Aeromonas veronii]
MTYHELSIEECVTIQIGLSQRAIAKLLVRSSYTVSRELGAVPESYWWQRLYLTPDIPSKGTCHGQQSVFFTVSLFCAS